MSNEPTVKEKDLLESLIDKLDITTVQSMLVEICDEKAQHLRENWQDNNQAKLWDKNASQLLKLKLNRGY
jgi:hypothetical protein